MNDVTNNYVVFVNWFEDVFRVDKVCRSSSSSGIPPLDKCAAAGTNKDLSGKVG